MQSNHETLGDIIKSARQKADITIEDLASRVNITERYLYRIENEGKNPALTFFINSFGNCRYSRTQFSTPKSLHKIPRQKTLSV